MNGDITQTPEWAALGKHQEELAGFYICASCSRRTPAEPSA